MSRRRRSQGPDFLPSILTGLVVGITMFMLLLVFAYAAPPRSCAEQMYADGAGELVEAGIACNGNTYP